ncbi:hypothetical protein O53_882 [Microcystis aeruginosa TAIHU98]|uniref:Uncharacterized protein n=1 Tax=Microcystis aeruginosa TAIHU98 TaxID=1134457 RepID=L7E9Z4_MICAE|nr:hypothetical protein O53_882 [Microcystis aeruginosa TAIHU98]
MLTVLAFPRTKTLYLIIIKKIPKQCRSKPFNSEDNPKIQPEKEPER